MTRASVSCALVLIVSVAVTAQQPAGGRGGGQAPGRIDAAGIGTYPARPPADAAAVERGRAVDGRQHVLVAAGDTLYAFALY